MKIFTVENFDFNLAKTVNETIAFDVAKIIEETRKNGDRALISFCNNFDKTSFRTSSDLLVTDSEIKDAAKKLDKKTKDALKLAFKRIALYHKKQLPRDFNFTDSIGVKLGNVWRAIESVGVYVPGGTASYPSSVLMSAVPAIVAGVKEVSICAPTSSGKINPAVLYAAKLCNVKRIYKIGGAQAIAAMAYGTDSVKKVNKIVGPGNAYVAYAKKILFGEVGIDMIAGPTDLTIIADKENNPNWLAADALSQLEHGIDSRVFIITDNHEFALKIIDSINDLAKNLERKNIIEKSLSNSAIILVNRIEQAVEIANKIAPEHLEICAKNATNLAKKINNAGAIFLGNYTPESIGDYIAGPSHTLPTEGTAKFASGLSVFDFLKRVSLISCDEKSFNELAEATSILAASEGLTAHKLSIDIRLK